ncbi:unnamed protein product [Amoebophrya sp. A120]|nr:unnamed protein product [Amoebophrya sp. A120]|eukprot:GSA120T00020914001.1
MLLMVPFTAKTKVPVMVKMQELLMCSVVRQKIATRGTYSVISELFSGSPCSFQASRAKNSEKKCDNSIFMCMTKAEGKYKGRKFLCTPIEEAVDHSTNSNKAPRLVLFDPNKKGRDSMGGNSCPGCWDCKYDSGCGPKTTCKELSLHMKESKTPEDLGMSHDQWAESLCERAGEGLQYMHYSDTKVLINENNPDWMLNDKTLAEKCCTKPFMVPAARSTSASSTSFLQA